MNNMHIMDAYEHSAGTSGWTKSAYSDHGNACVEWVLKGETVFVRDSKYRGAEARRPILTVPARAWDAFLAIASGDALADGAVIGIPSIKYDAASGETTLIDTNGTTLTFTSDEWDAFTRSIHTSNWKLAAA